jgi:hypothetical protein
LKKVLDTLGHLSWIHYGELRTAIERANRGQDLDDATARRYTEIYRAERAAFRDMITEEDDEGVAEAAARHVLRMCEGAQSGAFDAAAYVSTGAQS